ncbi:MAG: PAS domain S-box protein, partial [Proteobacteria bacterium]|nr:PAS domain S-box protein [Pseudomonadota bacterium]
MENKNLDIKIIFDGLNQILNGNYEVCVDVSPQSELVEIGEKINKLSDELQSCFSAIKKFSRGVLSSDIKGSRGLPATLKTVQANFRHLSWQMERVADGDLSQKILPLGALSAAFNKMVIALDEARKELAAANAVLEKRVKERTVDLEDANVFLKLEIAERKKAEEKVAESEEKYRTLFDDSLESMSLTIDKKIVDVNHAWLRLHGFEDKNEVIGMNIIDVIHPEDQKTLVERRRMWPEKRGRVYQLRDVRKDGSVVFVEVYSSGICLGGKDAILATVRDRTMLKRAEEEKSALEEKVRRSEKMEAIGLLAGGVAHDLNNVLSGLVSYPDLLLMQIPENSSLRKPLLIIQKSGEKAVAIVQDLLTLARRGVIATEVVNLNDIIHEYLKSPEHQKLKSYHSNVQVETNLEADVLYILGSPVHLSKTVMNLVSNAAEAMPNGGKILISTESRYIDRPVRGYDYIDEGEYVSLSVSDYGVGISSEDIAKIFE